MQDIKNKLTERLLSELQDLEKAVDLLKKKQEASPSPTNELMLESLEYRRQKLLKSTA